MKTNTPRISATHPLLLIHEAARVAPGELGLVVDAKQYSYLEASVAIFSMADFLRSRGVSRGDLVAIDLPMDLDLLAKHALFLLGATSCSLFGFIKVPEGLDPTWLVTVPGKHPLSEQTLFFEIGGVPLKPEMSIEDFDLGFVLAERPAMLIFTSGTTGSNKAVVITDSQLEGRVRAYGQPEENLKIRASLIYNSGVGLFTQLEQLTHLKPIVFASSDSASMLAVMNQVRVSALVASPVQLVALLKIPEIATHLGEVEEFVVSGSLVSSHQLEALRTAVPKATIRTFYGANETGAVAECVRDSLDSSGLVGKPVSEAQIEIISDDGGLVSAGEIGVVRTKTPYMASYYYNEMMESAKAFRAGWFYPGDMGFLDHEGQLHLAGRASYVINAGGVKINPHNIETKVLSLDGITECAGVEIIGPAGISAFALAVVGKETIDLVRLEKLIKSYFPFGYPSVYKQVAALPRNQNGKIDKAALREMLES